MNAKALDRWVTGWRGPFLAAVIALLAAAPAVFTLPVIDRDEARLARSSAQILETGDFAATAVDDQPSDGRPVGLHWLLAAAGALSTDDRRIWAFRLPALAGAALAAASCAWGAAALFGARAGFAAGALLGASFIVSTAGVIAAPEILACAGLCLAMAAFTRLIAAIDAAPPDRASRLCFWLGVALAWIAVGPIGPALTVLSIASLWLVFPQSRKAPWARSLNWGWGLILLAALVGPSVIAGLVNAGPEASLVLSGAQEARRAPGFYLATTPLLMFPATLLLPAAAVDAWRRRSEPAVRVALCWLIPGWLILEFGHGLPLAGGLLIYGALAWLCASALRSPVSPGAAKTGAVLHLLAAAATIALVLGAALRFGERGALIWALAGIGWLAGAGLLGAGLLVRGRGWAAAGAAGALGLCAHVTLMAGMAPSLSRLWLSERAAEALARAGLDPRNGVTPGPVAVVGFSEPSLVFRLGGQSELMDPREAVDALVEGRPVLVEQRQEEAFLAALKGLRQSAMKRADIEGFDYSNGAATRLALYARFP